VRMLAAASSRQGAEHALVEEACHVSVGAAAAREVSCTSHRLQPMMKRSRGTSACVCVDMHTATSTEYDEFVLVRFDNCTEGGGSCTVGQGAAA
jgi:hypothetical protein